MRITLKEPSQEQSNTEIPTKTIKPAVLPLRVPVVWFDVATGLTLSCGLLGVAIADTAARTDLPWAQPLFWVALLVLVVPVAIRLAAKEMNATEAASLVAVLCLALYLVKVLNSPLGFTLHDEFYHYRTLDDIVTTGHVVSNNPLLPESPLYPGLELVTAALTSLSGMSYFVSGLVVVGAARLVFILALFALYRRISSSSRVAGVACIIYMCNPNFVFFDSVFSYESIALTFLIVILYIAVSSQDSTGKARLGVVGLLVLTLGALVMSHHITAYAMLGFLVLWLLADYYADYYKGAGSRDDAGQAWLAPLAFVLTLGWLILMGGATVGYLGPHLWGAFTEMTSMLKPHTAAASTGRQLFVSGTGEVSPLWERASALGGVGLLLLAIPFGIWQVWSNRRRMSTLAITLAATTLLYPVSLAFRLTNAGWEASNRSSEFLFLGLAFVVALGLCKYLVITNGSPWRFGIFAAGVAVIFISGLIAGWPPAWRLPWPYQIEAGTAGGSRDISPQGLQTAAWVLTHLGPGNRIGGDPTNMLLLGSFGRQQTQTSLSGGINTEWVLYGPPIDNAAALFLRHGQVRYIVVDRRLMAAPEVSRGFYNLTSLAAPLAKFDYLQGVSRLYDNGATAVYDIGVISGAH
jgi:hypothetical protein